MQISVEKAAKLERVIKVTIPAATVSDKFDNKALDLAKTAKIKGFRPGKVPVNYIKKRFHDSIYAEVVEKLIAEAVFRAYEDNDLKPAHTPEIDFNLPNFGNDLEFIASFEIMPTIDKIAFDKVKITKEIATITDADVDKVLSSMQKRFVDWVAVERGAKKGDQVTVDFKIFKDDAELKDKGSNDFSVVLGEGQVVEDFDKGLSKVKTGDEKKITVKMPKDYHSAELAGEKLEFAITVKKVAEPKILPLNDEFAKKFGIKSGKLEDLRQEIKNNLEREAAKSQRDKIKKDVLAALVAQNDIDVPKVLAEDNLKQRLEQDDNKGLSSKEKAKLEEDIVNAIKTGILVNGYIIENKITVDEAKVREVIADMVSMYDDPEQMMEWFYSQEESMKNIRMKVVEDKVIDKLLQQATIVDKQVTFSELTGRDLD